MGVIRQDVRSTDGTMMPVWISGSGPPLLVVHGSLTDHRQFELLRPHLEARMTVAAMDRRTSFADPLGRHQLTQEFDDIAAVVSSLGDDVSVFGHSAGAVCVLGAAPQLRNLRRLAIYEPPIRNKPNWPEASRKMDEMQKSADVDGIFALFMMGEAGLPESAARNVKTTELGARLFASAHTLPREMAALAGWTIEIEQYRSLRAPTLYVVGSQTPDDRQGYRQLLQTVIPDFRIATIEGQGHFAHTFAPEALAGTLLEFLLP